jgi:topoisomerase-4 subunit A
MAQDFAQRYPLIDGQGNFGSRDGDGAAAMRYTEARLAPIARLLLDEIDEGTVDFQPNYDGSDQEPRLLPARLPFVLLNGARASPWAGHRGAQPQPARGGGGHRALLKNDKLSDDELHALLPGRTSPAAARSSAPRPTSARPTARGRGSLKLRARWIIEDLARGQWQLVVTELPPGTSTQKVLEEIEELTNPKVKAGKKALTPGAGAAQAKPAGGAGRGARRKSARTRRCAWCSSPRAARWSRPN